MSNTFGTLVMFNSDKPILGISSRKLSKNCISVQIDFLVSFLTSFSLHIFLIVSTKIFWKGSLKAHPFSDQVNIKEVSIFFFEFLYLMTQERSAVLTPKFHLSKKNLGFIFTIVMSEIYSNGPVQVQIFDKIFRSWKRSVETEFWDFEIFLVMDSLEATFLLSCTVWHDSLIVIWDVLGNNGHSVCSSAI